MQFWGHGFTDMDQPLAPPGSTASQDGVMVPLTTPEQFMIGSNNSIPPEQPDCEPQLDQGGGSTEQNVPSSWADLNAPNSQIAGVPAQRLQLPDNEFGSMPVSSNPNPTPHAFPAEDPDDQSGGPIVPAGLPAMMPHTPQEDFNSLRSLTNVGLPEVHMILCGQGLVLRPTQKISPESWR